MKVFAIIGLSLVAAVQIQSDPIAPHLLPKKPEPPTPPPPYKPSDSGSGGYNRVIPEQFTTGADD